MTRALPRAVFLTSARFDSSCPVCGALVLKGDDVCGPFGPDDRRVWVHSACLHGLYRAADLPAPDVRRHAAHRPADSPAAPRHRDVNRADQAPCYLCGRRIILGRDGDPIPTPDGKRARHATCPDRPTLPCGHTAVYKRGALEGECRACHRKGAAS